MTISPCAPSHRRIGAAAVLDPAADTALYIVMLLRAGTNRVNAALHVLGTTTDGVGTPVQIGDLNHTYKPKNRS